MTLVVAATLIFVFGCAGPKIKTTEIDEAEQTAQVVEETPEAVVEQPTAVPTKAPEAPRERKYRVVKADTLWDISGLGEVMSDPWLWPLLYKANHAEIDDPDLIFVDQEFSIPKGASQADMSDATDDAKNTPRYRAHSEPRKNLPLDYLD